MVLDWAAEILRISLFSNSAVNLSSDDWKAITGDDEPKVDQKSLGRHSMQGSFLEGLLNLSASGSRLDCVLGPQQLPIEEMPENYIPSVGHWPEICEEFMQKIEGWVSAVEFPVVRLAFGTILLARQPDIETAHKSLLGMLKSINGDPVRMRDLSFRINWPIESSLINGLMINRLTTWNVIKVQLQVPPPAGTMDEILLGEYVRLEIDHNTSGGHTMPFDQDRLAPICRELSNLALENATKGEVT